MRWLLAVALLFVGCDPGADGDDPAEDDGVCGLGVVDDGLDECAACVDEKCADVAAACAADDDCACLIECLERHGVGGVDGCLVDLGLAQRPTVFHAVEECVGFACPDDGDECATPADWVPPDADLVCDGAGSAAADGTDADCGFDDAVEFDPDGAVVQLAGLDDEFCLRVERRDTGGGGGPSTNWEIVDVRIGPPGAVTHVTSSTSTAGFCWYVSHHNFRDWLHVSTGARHYDVAFKHDGHEGDHRYDVYVFDDVADDDVCAAGPDGAGCVEGPVPLFPR